MPRSGSALGQLRTTVEEHPTTHVVEALAFVCKLYLTLIEDSTHTSCLVADQIGLQAVVVFSCIAHALANLLQIGNGLIRMTCHTGSLSQIQEYLGIAQFDEGSL